MKRLALVLGLSCCACREEPRVPGAGVQPGAAHAQPSQRPTVELAEPQPAVTPAEPAAAPPLDPAVDFAHVELADLLPLDLPAWPEFEAEAAARITSASAETDLPALRAELEGPR